MVLSAPTLAAISNVTLPAGAPMYIVLDGYDAEDGVSYTVSCDNAQVSTLIPNDAQNRSLKINVAGYGEMVFQLFEELAPNTTGRIIDLAEDGFYDDLTFHRIIDDFMIQGGDPTGTGSGGSTLGDFDDEFHPLLMHTVGGMLSMAKSNDDTGDSQFFVTEVATRWLDFNHSVFGFQTSGTAVRDAISEVAVDSNDKPTTAVVIDSIDVFTDDQRGVLILSAPEGYTGTATVTVTASDGAGGTAQRQFTVNVVADTSSYANSAPWLGTMNPIETVSGQTGEYQIPAFDVEGNSIYYAGQVHPENDAIELFVDAVDGSVSFKTPKTIAGIEGFFFGVRALDGTAWDTQTVPVFITPAAPSVDLLASTDTGISASDNITNLNNSSDAAILRFRVSDVVPGAEVYLYAGEQLIGQGTAITDTVTIITDGEVSLSDGTHSIRAKQVFSDEADIGNEHYSKTFTSAFSTPIQITVDTVAPEITSAPGTEVLAAGTVYQYDVQASGEASANIRYRLVNSPAGMTIDAQTGVISWTPGGTAQGPFAITVIASDLAGNEDSQQFSLSVNLAPVVTPVNAKSVYEQQLLEFTVSATDADGGLTYRLAEGAPQGAAIDAQTGKFSWTPSEAQGPQKHYVTVEVVDSFGSVGKTTFTVDVWESNTPPAVAAIADQSAMEDQLLSLTVVATDADIPHTLTYSLGQGTPQGVAIDPQTGRLTWTPNELQGGAAHSITVVVTDNAGASAETTFTVTVAENDKPPAFAPLESATGLTGGTVRLEFRAADQDVPAAGVVYSLEPGSPEGASIDAATGTVTWEIPSGFPMGTVAISVRATEVRADGSLGLSTTAAVEVRVLDYRLLYAAAVETSSNRDTVFGNALAQTQAAALLADSDTPTAREVVAAAIEEAADEGILGFQFGAANGIGLDGGAGSAGDSLPAAPPFELPRIPTTPARSGVTTPQPSARTTPAAPPQPTTPPATPARPAAPQPRAADAIMEEYEREY